MQCATCGLAKPSGGFGNSSHLHSKVRRSACAVAAILFAALTFVPSAVCRAQSSQARITGMAHMAYYVSDLKKARDYYEGWLGFQEAFVLRNADGSEHVVFIKINDRQYIELYNEAPKNHGFIHDAGFETNDAKGMRDHLAAIGVKVPDQVSRDASGNLSFDILDPSGFTIQIVQYLPDSMTSRAKGKFMPASRISDHIDHIGLLVNDRAESWKFYGDAFGFTKEGDGSKMAVPDSPDRFELGVEKKDAYRRGPVSHQGSHLPLQLRCPEDDGGIAREVSDQRVPRCHRRYAPIGQRQECCGDLRPRQKSRRGDGAAESQRELGPTKNGYRPAAPPTQGAWRGGFGVLFYALEGGHDCGDRHASSNHAHNFREVRLCATEMS